MYFASDNTAGMAPEILAALAKANTGYALGYGNDAWTTRVEQRFAAIFERARTRLEADHPRGAVAILRRERARQQVD